MNRIKLIAIALSALVITSGQSIAVTESPKTGIATSHAMVYTLDEPVPINITMHHLIKSGSIFLYDSVWEPFEDTEKSIKYMSDYTHLELISMIEERLKDPNQLLSFYKTTFERDPNQREIAWLADPNTARLAIYSGLAKTLSPDEIEALATEGKLHRALEITDEDMNELEPVMDKLAGELLGIDFEEYKNRDFESFDEVFSESLSAIYEEFDQIPPQERIDHVLKNRYRYSSTMDIYIALRGTNPFSLTDEPADDEVGSGSEPVNPGVITETLNSGYIQERIKMSNEAKVKVEKEKWDAAPSKVYIDEEYSGVIMEDAYILSRQEVETIVARVALLRDGQVISGKSSMILIASGNVAGFVFDGDEYDYYTIKGKLERIGVEISHKKDI